MTHEREEKSSEVAREVSSAEEQNDEVTDPVAVEAHAENQAQLIF